MEGWTVCYTATLTKFRVNKSKDCLKVLNGGRKTFTMLKRSVGEESGCTWCLQRKAQRAQNGLIQNMVVYAFDDNEFLQIIKVMGAQQD